MFSWNSLPFLTIWQMLTVWPLVPLPFLKPSQNGHHQKSLQIINARKGVEKREPSYTIGGNVNWCSYCEEQYGGSLKKLKIELPYDTTSSLLGIHLEKMKILIQKDTRTTMFTAALLTIPKSWKQPKCSSTNEWIKKTATYIHTHWTTTQQWKWMK